MRVQEVGPFGADCADDVAGEPRRDVDPAADTTVRDLYLLEPLVEPRRLARQTQSDAPIERTASM